MYFMGTHLFGRVDKVAGGLIYVGTFFFHILFIPLLPLQSYIVRRDKDAWGLAFEGVPISTSLKSVLYAWARVAAAVAILSPLYGYAVHGLATRSEELYIPLVSIGLGLLVLLVLRATSHASDARAAELKALSGYPTSEAELAAEKAAIAAGIKRDEEEAARRRSDPKWQAENARWQEAYRRSQEGAWVGGVLRDFARARGWNVYLVRIAFVGLPVLALYLLTGIVPWLGLVPAAIIYVILWNRTD